MPSDANGVYSLPDGYLAVTGETILASQHNPPLEDLAASMTLRMMRSGVTPMTGQLKLVDGSVAAPGISFSGATSTGLYKTTAGFGVAIGGVKVAEFVAGGLKTGARYIGELIPFSGSAAPALTVLPYGQTLDRTTYADLWAFAQIEIAAGNTFYNNGNGSTTFGIGDLRGRVVAGSDAMGGVAAGRLTDAVAGIDSIGNAGGAQSRTLTTPNLPPYTPSGSVSTSISGQSGKAVGTSFGTVQAGNTVTAVLGGEFMNLTASSNFTGSAQGGTSTPVVTVQPTMVCNYLLFAGA